MSASLMAGAVELADMVAALAGTIAMAIMAHAAANWRWIFIDELDGGIPPLEEFANVDFLGRGPGFLSSSGLLCVEAAIVEEIRFGV